MGVRKLGGCARRCCCVVWVTRTRGETHSNPTVSHLLHTIITTTTTTTWDIGKQRARKGSKGVVAVVDACVPVCGSGDKMVEEASRRAPYHTGTTGQLKTLILFHFYLSFFLLLDKDVCSKFLKKSISIILVGNKLKYEHCNLKYARDLALRNVQLQNYLRSPWVLILFKELYSTVQYRLHHYNSLVIFPVNLKQSKT